MESSFKHYLKEVAKSTDIINRLQHDEIIPAYYIDSRTHEQYHITIAATYNNKLKTFVYTVSTNKSSYQIKDSKDIIDMFESGEYRLIW